MSGVGVLELRNHVVEGEGGLGPLWAGVGGCLYTGSERVSEEMAPVDVAL